MTYQYTCTCVLTVKFSLFFFFSTDKIKSLFLNIEFSQAGSVEREAEELVYLMFIDLLHDIEGMAK